MLLLDEDDKIVEANHAAEEMLGRSARKLSEKRFWDVVGISDQRLSDRLQSNDAQIVARGATIATAIGDRRVNISSSPMPGENGWRVLTLSDAGQPENDEDEAERTPPPSLASAPSAGSRRSTATGSFPSREPWTGPSR